MVLPAPSRGTTAVRAPGLLAVAAAGLLAGACASGDTVSSLDSFLGAPQQSAGGARPADPARAASELERALAYWGDEHKKKPADVKVSLAYARNLKAAGHKEQAFQVLQGAAIMHGDNKELASEMGRLALEFDQVGVAEKLLAMADDPTKPDWRVISARGTVMAKQNRFGDAIPLFERALQLSSSQPSVMSNLAMAHAANGDPAKAEEILRRARAASNDPKIAQNLAIVLGLQGKHDEARTVTANVVPAATAAADADFVRRMVTPSGTAAPATPAVAARPQPAAPASARAIEAKAPARSAPQRPATASALRPGGGPRDVAAPAGAWSTTVQAGR
jgi:Flp pilus assembly protein TadD